MRLLYVAALIFYLLCFLFLIKALREKKTGINIYVAASWLAALLCHAAILWSTVVANGHVNLPFFRAASLMTFIISAIAVTTALYRNLAVVGVIITPLAIVFIISDLLAPSSSSLITANDSGVHFHILSSLLAYGVFSFAGMLAILLYFQNRQLKSSRGDSSLLIFLPPLDAMEAFVFNLIWAGILLLTPGLISGWIYHEDLFAQHLAHKTTLSIASWLVFAFLLLGRSLFGWRGKRAIRFILSGIFLLILAYFGSKFVLEFLLS